MAAILNIPMVKQITLAIVWKVFIQKNDRLRAEIPKQERMSFYDIINKVRIGITWEMLVLAAILNSSKIKQVTLTIFWKKNIK